MSMNNNDTTFGSFIETRRKQKQINIRKMAEMLGITPAYLSNIEKNRCCVKCKAYQLSV